MCWGTVTALGGSLMAPNEVLQAVQSAAGAFVDMSELHTATGRRIADLLGVEACCVTCGAAAGLAIAAAACMTGTPLVCLSAAGHHRHERRDPLPQMPRPLRSGHAALRRALCGDRRDVIGVFAADRGPHHRAHGGVFYTSGPRPCVVLPEIAALCRAHGIPIIVDAAAELPPKANIRKYLDDGASLVVFSGSKEINGPAGLGHDPRQPRADVRAISTAARTTALAAP